MRIAAQYSHLNGIEYLQVHKPTLWDEVQEVIAGIDAEQYRTKISEEQTMPGRILYSPKGINQAFKTHFGDLGWESRKRSFYLTHDESVLRDVVDKAPREQKKMIEERGLPAIYSYNQTDFVKDRVAVEVQFGKYTFVAHDLFVKHLSFFVSDVIDVGIEILPTKELEKEMSSGVPYYERDLLNVIRQGRGVPAVPLILIGISP